MKALSSRTSFPSPSFQWLILILFGLSSVTAAALAADKPLPPRLGPNVSIFTPTMSAAAIQRRINQVYAIEQHNEFGPQRFAFLFLPGTYHVDVPIGFYTQVLGLGASPDDTRIDGNLHVDAASRNNNATTTFWRGAEGLTVTPPGGTMQWAVSQAVPFRRMHVRGNMVLSQRHGWASGGWISDSLIDGTVNSSTQQQWIARNADWTRWNGSNWNMVFVGVNHPPMGNWPQPPYTKVARTPVVREKPFLMVDSTGRYFVRIPALRRNSVGITWHSGSTPGTSIPLSSFYIARPDIDSAATLNAQLASGKNLLLTPGIYPLKHAIHASRLGSVVLGLGFATLKPVDGTPAMITSDADGIIIAGVLFDAGPIQSPVLLQIGPNGSHRRHIANPISLHDVFFRVGGAGAGRTKINLEVNCDDTIIDHTWIWRADHGSGVGWNLNTSDNGLVVNGSYVTAYGLFVEHHQQFQVLWNGDYGRTYFYQSEIPYDPPNQASYSSASGTRGWASYKVADSVTHHQAWGLGIYSVFTYPGVVLDHAVEAPQKTGVRFHHIITVALGRHGAIQNVIDNTGGATSMHPRVTPQVSVFP
jgi:hypothetical protein